jgi:putative phosphoribosyl transferase
MTPPAETILFLDREDAGRRLGRRLKTRELRDPLVLAIPRGGVVTGSALAAELGAELDVVLSRKLRAPFHPEYAIGAVSEDGRIVLNPEVWAVPGVTESYLETEKRDQLAEIARRRDVIRAVRPAARVEGRSVVVTDDGIATGATMIAALRTARAHRPHELIVAVPVASPDRLTEVRRFCSDVLCLCAPDDFAAVGQFYERFDQVDDRDVVRLLREAAVARASDPPGARRVVPAAG